MAEITFNFPKKIFISEIPESKLEDKPKELDKSKPASK